jgi:hypothetical protein
VHAAASHIHIKATWGQTGEDGRPAEECRGQQKYGDGLKGFVDTSRHRATISEHEGKGTCRDWRPVSRMPRHNTQPGAAEKVGTTAGLDFTEVQAIHQHQQEEHLGCLAETCQAGEQRVQSPSPERRGERRNGRPVSPFWAKGTVTSSCHRGPA